MLCLGKPLKGGFMPYPKTRVGQVIVPGVSAPAPQLGGAQSMYCGAVSNGDHEIVEREQHFGESWVEPMTRQSGLAPAAERACRGTCDDISQCDCA